MVGHPLRIELCHHSIGLLLRHSLGKHQCLDGRVTTLLVPKEENLRRERQKLERYFDYRAVAASDKVTHAGSVVGRLEASDDPSDQKILPVWRSNLERAVAVEEGLIRNPLEE